MGECITLLWLIETFHYLLLSEWTVFSITWNMCSKDPDEQYTLDIVFLFWTALFLISVSLLQMHYICFTLCGYLVIIRPKCSKQLLLPYNSYWKSLQTVMFVNASNYVPQDVFKVRPLLVESLVIVIFYVIFYVLCGNY